MKKRHEVKFNIVTCLVLVTAVASSAFVIKGVLRQPEVSAYAKKAAELAESIEYEHQRIEEIDAVMEKVGTDEYIEKIAREKLGMIKSDEIVFVDISGQ